MTLEDIILDRDHRGMSTLRQHLPKNFCGQAARLILDNPGTVVIITGFYIMAARAPETDGPPGAKVIADALGSIGYEVVYVTDRYSGPVMSSIAGSDSRVIDFPITDDKASREFADGLLKELDPSVVIAIERCGLTSEGLYRNMYGKEITPYNARLDYLVSEHPNTVGIGDGGNEIGMGNLASVITTVPTLVKIPCAVTTTKLIISSVSNWGGYGLVAALSALQGRNLLPTVEAEQELIKRTVDMGAVDGWTAKADYKVDGFSLDENSDILARLHSFLAEQGVPS